MNNILFNIYLKTNGLRRMPAQKFKDLTMAQIDAIMSGNYISQLSNEQLSAMHLDEFVHSYDFFSGDKQKDSNIVQAVLKSGRQNIIEKEYLYFAVYDCAEIGLDEKWKLFSENHVNHKEADRFQRDIAIKSMLLSSENEFIEKLETDKSFEDSFLKEVSASNQALIMLLPGARSAVCSNEKFQKEFVNPKLLCTMNGRLFEIYENLSEDKRHLIAFYDYQNTGEVEENKSKFVELFQRNYAGVLDETEIGELIDLRENYETSYGSNVLENQKNKEYELVSNILKELSNNPDYYKEIKMISEKFCDGDIKKAAFFSQRYKNEAIRQELLSASKQLSEEELKKVDYLFTSKKKIGIKNIDDLSLYTLDELKQMPILGDKTEVAYLGVKGTPDNNKNRRIFNHNREIVLIDSEGNIETREAPIDHCGTLKGMLENSKIDVSNYDTAFEIGVQVAKEERSICMTTENSSAIIYFPKEISENQKNQYVELMEGIRDIDSLDISCMILDNNNITTISKFDTPDISPSQLYSDKFINRYFNVNGQERNGMSSMAKECISEYSVSNAEMQRFEAYRNKELYQAVASKETIMEGNGEDGR